MKIIDVVNKLLKNSQRKRCCSDDVIDVSFDEAGKRTIIRFVDKLFFVANEKSGIPSPDV